MALAVKGEDHPHPQGCPCPPGTHPGPPEDRALRPKCRTWSGATTLQISGTSGRHHRALGRKEALSQPARGWDKGHTHCPSTIQPRPTTHHSPAGLLGPGLSDPVTGHPSTWGKCGDPWESASPQRSPPESPPTEPSMPRYSVAGRKPSTCGSGWRLLTSAAAGCHLCKRTVTAVALAAKGPWATRALPTVGGTGARGGAHRVAVTWEARVTAMRPVVELLFESGSVTWGQRSELGQGVRRTQDEGSREQGALARRKTRPQVKLKGGVRCQGQGMVAGW